jgi:hypothetical protein
VKFRCNKKLGELINPKQLKGLKIVTTPFHVFHVFVVNGDSTPLSYDDVLMIEGYKFNIVLKEMWNLLVKGFRINW